jgi:hypothetical protein
VACWASGGIDDAIMEIHQMSAPSAGLAISFEIRLFMRRTTIERRNSYGLGGTSQPRHTIRDRARLLDTLAGYGEPMSDSGR